MATPTTLSRFVSAYIASALWSTNDESTPQGGEPLDAKYDSDDIAPESMTRIVAECSAFLDTHMDDILTWDGRGDAVEQAGHDLWMTRNGHGVGFWESEWGEPGKRLDKASKQAGERDIVVGDDGKLYYEGGR